MGKESRAQLNKQTLSSPYSFGNKMNAQQFSFENPSSGDFTYLPPNKGGIKPLRTHTAEAGTRQGRRNIIANLN